MNFDIDTRTILKVRHGSHAYGLATPTSDIDTKGVCIEPGRYHFGFMNVFEQFERMASKSGNGEDLVIYSLKKFARLVADCNPNIIEVLFVDDSDVLHIDRFGEALRNARHDFLSKKAKFTFSGYAHAQLKRIKTHRAWLLNPPVGLPDRKSFGLSEVKMVSKSELGAYDSLVAERCGVSELPSESEKLRELGLKADLPHEIVSLFVKEKAYQAARMHYEQYNTWVKSRNPARALLEAEFGYDTKHGSHLLRLMRMCKEILATGEVIVKRPDRDELLAVKYGERSYDSLIEESERLEAECELLYETSSLRKSPDREKLDDLVIKLTEDYLRLNG